MIAFVVDIADIRFWMTALGAIFLLNLFAESRWRSPVWAAVNVGFLAVLLGASVLPALAGLGLVYLALRALSGEQAKVFPLKLIALASFGLFLIHKLPVGGYSFRDLLWSLEPFLSWPMAVVLGLFFVWAFRRRRFRLPAEFLGLALAGILIVVVLTRQFPSSVGMITFDPARNILSVIGFSYVALRLVEIFRAVYEGRHPAPDFTAVINYLVPFHMLGAGPIQAYDQFAAQPAVAGPLPPVEILRSVERLAFGLFKKYVLAASIHTVFLSGFQDPGAYTFIEAQMFFLWLYLDFSAYADIAVGLGRLMGVATPENFNHPYLARNMVDFWERWHISLSHFIQRNVYIPIFATLMRSERNIHPLAGSTVAFTIAFLLCGLWHDLTLNFLLWGAAHAFGLVVTNAYQFWLKRRLGTPGVKAYRENGYIRVISTFLTYEFVAFSLLLLYFPR